MGIIASKSGKVLKVAGVGLLLTISLISTIQVEAGQRKKKSLITCEGETPDSIILTLERQRTRVFLDILKKLTLMPIPVPDTRQVLRELNSGGMKSLFVNAYQRNVFYIFAFSTVP